MPTIQKTSEGKEIVVFNDNADDIRNIAFEKITNDYSWVQLKSMILINVNIH
jgi:hypothetical protein